MGGQFHLSEFDFALHEPFSEAKTVLGCKLEVPIGWPTISQPCLRLDQGVSSSESFLPAQEEFWVQGLP